MTAAAIQATRGAPGLDWRKAGLAAAAVGLNAGAIGLLSLGPLGTEGPRPAAALLIHVDIEPRPRLAGERAREASAPADVADAPAARPEAPRLHVPPNATAAPPAMAADGVADLWRVDPSVSGARRPPLPGLAGCGSPDRLSPDARALCQERRARLAEGAAPITGSGDADRDAAFARQGARRMTAWEAQRARPARGDPPCETPHPVAGCEGANVQVELFSSRDGLLPNLRKRRQ